MNNYKGSIELISGITPKNGGPFPLVNAKDVLMPDGSRLSDLQGIEQTYNSLQDAIKRINSTNYGSVAARYENGQLYITLLSNITVDESVWINKTVLLNLNGHTINITNIDACIEVSDGSLIIDGTIPGSTVKKCNLSSNIPNQEFRIINTSDSDLTLVGGKYIFSDIVLTGTNSQLRAIRHNGSPCYISDVEIEMYNSDAYSIGYAIQSSDPIHIKDSKIRVISGRMAIGIGCTSDLYANNLDMSSQLIEGYPNKDSWALGIYHLNYIDDANYSTLQLTVNNSKIITESPLIGTSVYSVLSQGSSPNNVELSYDKPLSVISITNCRLEADGYSDYKDGSSTKTVGVYAFSAGAYTKSYLNGGYYWGGRDAISSHGKIRIDGGIFGGPQHGGAYISGPACYARNAIFCSTNAKKYWNEVDNWHGGCIYIGGISGGVKAYFDNCKFVGAANHTSNGVCVKYSPTEAYLSNCEVVETLGTMGGQLRVTNANNFIYLGKNVITDGTEHKPNGVIDWVTYKDKVFDFTTPEYLADFGNYEDVEHDTVANDWDTIAKYGINVSKIHSKVANLDSNVKDLNSEVEELTSDIEELNALTMSHRYLDISSDGTVSLKPEYRASFSIYKDSGITPESIFGDTGWYEDEDSDGKAILTGREGSLYREFPQTFIIPNILNGITVSKLSPYMFAYNNYVEEVRLPAGITIIPNRCFIHAKNLRVVLGTVDVTKVEAAAFGNTSITSLEFPNLAVMGEQPFAAMKDLRTIDIGNVTEIPMAAFYLCRSLYSIIGGKSVTKIGRAAFYSTYNLQHLDCIFYQTEETDPQNNDSTITIDHWNNNLGEKSIGGAAFIASAFDDFSGIDNSVFADYSISYAKNPPESFSEFRKYIKQQENPAPAIIEQSDSKWRDYIFYGDEKDPKHYNSGCRFISFIHAYAGLYGLQLHSPDEFEGILKEIETRKGKSLIEYTAKSPTTWYKDIADFFDLRYECLDGTMTVEEKLRKFYTAFSEGKYAIIGYPSKVSDFLDSSNTNPVPSSGHVVMVHGIREDGRVCIVDSANPDRNDSLTVLTQTGAIPLRALIREDSKIHLYSRYDIVESKVTPQLFGAMADGVHDDTLAIQKALDSGNTVYIPEGKYLVTQRLFTKPYTNISGDGNSTIIRCNSAKDLFMMAYATNISDIRVQVITNEDNKMDGAIFKMNEESLAASIPHHCNNVRSSINNILIEANGDAVTSGHLACFETSLMSPWGPDNNKRLGIYGLTVDNINVSFSVNAGLGYFYRSYVGPYIDESTGKPLWVTSVQFSNCGMIGPRWCFFMGHQDDNMFEYKGECELTAYNVFHQKTDENCIGFLFQRANTRVSLFGCEPWDWNQHGNISTHCPYVIDTDLCNDATTYWLDNSRGNIWNYRMISNGDDRYGGTPLTHSDYNTYYSFLKKPFLTKFFQRAQALRGPDNEPISLLACIPIRKSLNKKIITFEYQYLQTILKCSIYLKPDASDSSGVMQEFLADGEMPTGSAFYYSIEDSDTDSDTRIFKLYHWCGPSNISSASVVKEDCFTNSIAHFSGDGSVYADYLATLNGLDYNIYLTSAEFNLSTVTNIKPKIPAKTTVLEDADGKRWKLSVGTDGTLSATALD